VVPGGLELRDTVERFVLRRHRGIKIQSGIESAARGLIKIWSVHAKLYLLNNLVKQDTESTTV